MIFFLIFKHHMVEKECTCRPARQRTYAAVAMAWIKRNQGALLDTCSAEKNVRKEDPHPWGMHKPFFKRVLFS